MRDMKLWLLGAVLVPGAALASEAETAERPAATPGIEVGIEAAMLADERVTAEVARPAPAEGYARLDFRLDQTREIGEAARTRHLDNAHATAVAAASEEGDPRLGPEASFATPFNGYLGPYLAVNYRSYGESHEQQLGGALTRSFGMALSVEETVLLFSYDRSDAPLAGVEPEDLFAAATNRLAPDVTLTFYGMRGMSAGMADTTVGTALTFSFMR